jgi:hypothetical protein
VVITDIKDIIDLGSLTQTWHWILPSMVLNKDEIKQLEVVVNSIAVRRDAIDEIHKRTLTKDYVASEEEAAECQKLFLELKDIRKDLDRIKDEMRARPREAVPKGDPYVEKGEPAWLKVITDAYVKVYGSSKQTTVDGLIRGIHQAAVSGRYTVEQQKNLQSIIHGTFGEEMEDIVFYMESYMKKNRKFISEDAKKLIKF